MTQLVHMPRDRALQVLQIASSQEAELKTAAMRTAAVKLRPMIDVLLDKSPYCPGDVRLTRSEVFDVLELLTAIEDSRSFGAKKLAADTVGAINRAIEDAPSTWTPEIALSGLCTALWGDQWARPLSNFTGIAHRTCQRVRESIIAAEDDQRARSLYIALVERFDQLRA